MSEGYNTGASKTTNALMVVAVIAVAIALFGVITSIVKQSAISGFASVEQGNATLNIIGSASLNFTTKLINWSTGQINTSCGTRAVLATNGTNVCSATAANTWNVISQGLVLENNGGTNVQVDLVSSNDAPTFLGGTAPTYQWKIANLEAGSCAGVLSNTTFADVATGTARTVCTNLTFGASADTLLIDLKVDFDTNALGQKNSVITATATTVA
jgi:hypothetical protein